MAEQSEQELGAETTPEKQRGVPFKKGQSGNPAGRPKGARNRLGEEFISALANDFDNHGIEAIERVRTERPQDYLKVIAGLLPKEIKLTDERDLSDEELDRRIRSLASVLGDFLASEGGTLTVSTGSGPETAH